MTEEVAIEVRRAYKRYGRKQNANQILNNLDMTVPKGSIYGLLGASGCGKTTLLSCVVGRQHLNSGVIRVLGGKPGAKGSGVPGPRVGYMPQDVALVGEFTVKGALKYFGWICGMKDTEIEERFEFLNDLLELPPNDRYVKNLSGGQQRRVSFAAALVHSPELLILDEPTVGLDPVLRSGIWDYLVELTADKEVTVIITTHYIEEAKQANIIGLLRQGKLLAEKSPIQLMTAFNTPNLEDVFLILSQRQDAENRAGSIPTHADCLHDSSMDQEKESKLSSITSNITEKCKHIKQYEASVSGRMRALLTKNFQKIIRHWGGLFFIFGFPVLELLAFFFAIGGEPQGIKLAVVNDELGNVTNCKEYSSHYPTKPILHEDQSCDYYGLSCNYLDRLNQTKVYFEDMETALESVRRGISSGVLHFSSNFSKELHKRQDEGKDASNTTIRLSELGVNLDMSNRQIALSVEKNLLETYLDFAADAMRTCNLSAKLAKIPMQFKDPVFGAVDQNYTEFMAPGLVISMVFFLSTILTATIIITEKNEGVWDRSIVAGVTTTEILISHIMTQVVSMLLQVVIVLVVTFGVFRIPCHGSYTTMAILIALQGFSGMCFGFLVSVICDNLTTANYFSLGSFYPYIFLCGMLWPLEGMPKFLRVVAVCLPGTVPILSLHNILERGKSIVESQVYIGFIVTAIWIVLQCSLCIVILKIKNK
ncbi:ABC transporter G family member 20-like [Periplaneta americana]|uniref:ABC transporter G family member 20-like n=1 Tax=Periplaneta americana TaxID=6978 RepID=UPI0037E8FF55